MTLHIEDLVVRYGSDGTAPAAVDGVDLTVADGEVVALLGPSGCGKSTLLRAVAGLEPPAGGRIRWDDTDLARVPAHRRGFGLMFQDGVLFPHRDVGGNIGYGLERNGVRRIAIRERVDELLDLVGLPGFAGRAVGTLSGGQAQRVALARALAPRPRLLLLDEPLAALDRELRERLIGDLREVLRSTGTTALYVTHDQGEAFALADRVGLMDAGRIRQLGAPAQVWSHPADAWVAGFVGFGAVRDAGELTAATGVPLAPGDWALRPAAFEVVDGAGLAATVLRSLPGPDRSRVRVELPSLGELDALGPPGPPAPGTKVHLRFDPTHCAPLGA
ncbi:ATP-binding cassette domain-containing protein [Nakamurella sp. YIM 132087]|uniref:ABC-type quaternary amine transporter n=1 Tax=Nakamurella alba TaxID=2665158 RepID=A0A7K1FFN5_9ACTN|nr:ABC transporter ATP-binding protein [Nakamurella alba]MTD12917.1 ATP-binding cassette domain-containing protein [Nakamurella alba]